MPDNNNYPINVGSEVGTLKRLLVHSPDSGIGKVVPSKAQDWLFEDIVHLDTIRRGEYDYYTKLLLYFLDPEKIQGKIAAIDAPSGNREFYKPCHEGFHNSDKVVELQAMLAEILEMAELKLRLVASVCALEVLPYHMQDTMMQLPAADLAKVFISGTLNEREMIFAPIPNFIFTRDIGIVINNYLLLNKPAKQARTREALLAKYIFFNHPWFAALQNNIIELPEVHQHFLNPRENEDRRVTLEGGDVMVVHPQHVLIGVSERTSLEAANQAVKILFEKKVVSKVTVVQIPAKRDYMHIDTVFTQVKRNVWVMLGQFAKAHSSHAGPDAIEEHLNIINQNKERTRIIQFTAANLAAPIRFETLEDLLHDITCNDYGFAEPPTIILSGNNEFPYDAREQWTDSCNLLALKEGVVLGYDRNDKTAEAFKHKGFHVVGAKELLDQFEAGTTNPNNIQDTLILMPSAELSRARGGFHCMSMPLLRQPI